MRIFLILLSLLVLLGGCARHKPANRPPRAVAAVAIPGEGRLLAKFSSGEAPLTIRFDGSRSHDDDGEIVKFHWDFGDGATSEEEEPSHTYTAAGEFTVTLTVIDDRGATGRDGLTVLVLMPERHRPPAEPELDGLIAEGEYQYRYHDEATGIELFWTVSGELIYLGLVGPGGGWIGLGLAVNAPQRGMEGLDLLLGAVAEGRLIVRDDYADGPSHHSPDLELGGRDDILAAEGGEEGGRTAIELVRKMNTEDKFDTPIINDWMVAALAYVEGDDLDLQHGKRAMVRINFFKGEVEPLEEMGG